MSLKLFLISTIVFSAVEAQLNTTSQTGLLEKLGDFVNPTALVEEYGIFKTVLMFALGVMVIQSTVGLLYLFIYGIPVQPNYNADDTTDVVQRSRRALEEVSDAVMAAINKYD
jgi:hypothetical protein